MKKYTVVMLAAMMATSAYAMPPITGTPTIDGPPVLNWPSDSDTLPSLGEPTANSLNDLHGNFSNCDLLLSTAGNYHMALKELWPLYFEKYGDLDNWAYTTSPPVADTQIANGHVRFGNLTVSCRPQVAVGGKKQINKLLAAGVVDGEVQPLYGNRGNVLLVKYGNPKHIRGIWDLGRPDVSVVTPNPTLEGGAFGNYAQTIYDIAANQQPYRGMTADELFNRVFNSGRANKWYAGSRIHHREVPWSVAYGNADVGLLFYHLAKHAVETFPGMFEIVPLGGTVDNPMPLPGNPDQPHFIARITGNWTPAQLEARERLVETLRSSEFAEILTKHGLVPAAK